MKAARGYIYPEWELAARTDPDFTDAYTYLLTGLVVHVKRMVKRLCPQGAPLAWQPV